MKVINIQWNVDCEKDLETLPIEIEIPRAMTDDDVISDYISDVTGFCHCGYEIVETNKVQQLLDRIEELGWNVINEEDDCYSLSQFSLAGQDFNVHIRGENSDELIQSIYEAYENYDVSYETYLWLDSTGHGTNGAPYELEDVLKDMKWCENAILELYKTLINEEKR